MASSGKKLRQMFSLEEVAEMFSRDQSDDGDIDSDHQGMSSGEESELDRQLFGEDDDEESSYACISVNIVSLCNYHLLYRIIVFSVVLSS